MRSVDFFAVLAAMTIAFTPSVFAQEKDKPKDDSKPLQSDDPKPKVTPAEEPDKPSQPPEEKSKGVPKKDNQPDPEDKTKPKDKTESKDKTEPKNKAETSKTEESAKTATTSPEMTYFGKRFKEILGEMEAMQEAYELHRKKIDTLTAELKLLRKANQQLAMQAKLQYATRQDIDPINTRIDQVDKNRKKDRDLILTEFTKLNRKLGQLANAQQAPVATPDPPESNEEFIEHTVEKGEFLSAIIVAYNQHLKGKGFRPVTTRDILNANPKLKPELIQVGQKIKIPRRKKS